MKSRLPVILIGLNPYDRIVHPEEEFARITDLKSVQSSVKRDLDTRAWRDTDLDLGRLANPKYPLAATSVDSDRSIRRVFSYRGQR